MTNNSEKKYLLFDKKVIEVIVKPNSGKNEIIFDEEKKICVVHVKVPAEDGKANSQVLKIIKKESGMTGKIISGATSRKKLIKLN
jgi:uncharacterized protein (TIGR00251 family)